MKDIETENRNKYSGAKIDVYLKNTANKKKYAIILGVYKSRIIRNLLSVIGLIVILVLAITIPLTTLFPAHNSLNKDTRLVMLTFIVTRYRVHNLFKNFFHEYGSIFQSK